MKTSYSWTSASIPSLTCLWLRYQCTSLPSSSRTLLVQLPGSLPTVFAFLQGTAYRVDSNPSESSDPPVACHFVSQWPLWANHPKSCANASLLHFQDTTVPLFFSYLPGSWFSITVAGFSLPLQPQGTYLNYHLPKPSPLVGSILSPGSKYTCRLKAQSVNPWISSPDLSTGLSPTYSSDM